MSQSQSRKGSLRGGQVSPGSRPDENPPPRRGVIVMAVVPAEDSEYGKFSMKVKCPKCHQVVFTKVKHKPNSGTHMMALILCLCLCTIPCMWMPYCLPACQTAHHYCPECGAYLGNDGEF